MHHIQAKRGQPSSCSNPVAAAAPARAQALEYTLGYDDNRMLALPCINVHCREAARLSDLQERPAVLLIRASLLAALLTALFLWRCPRRIRWWCCLAFTLVALVLLALITHRSRVDALPGWAMWSKGPLPHTLYQFGPTTMSASSAMLRDHLRATFERGSRVVWVRAGNPSGSSGCDLAVLAGLLEDPGLPSTAFVLISGDGDRSIPSELPPETVRALLESPRVVAWYAQNFEGNEPVHPKLRPWPIGLDLHTGLSDVDFFLHGGGSHARRRLDAIMQLRDERPTTARSLSVLFDAHRDYNRFGNPRAAAVRQLRNVTHVHFLQRRLGQLDVWREYTRHAFALSPSGNGLDAHRTWELLLLGTIPIVRRVKGLSPLFERLPVVQVDHWSECADARLLQAWYGVLHPLTDAAHVRSVLDEISSAPARSVRAKLENI